MKKSFFIILILFGLISGLAAEDRITGRMFATRSEVISTNGMVATSQPLAAQIGIDILKRGGTAVDAAIAVNAALGLMEPTGSGIGGDLFAIVWDNKSKKLYGLNASGPAPKALTLGYFKKQGLKRVPYYGPLPWTVPGCVDGWFELHKKFGKLKMETILKPAILYAEQGFPLSQLIAYYWQRSVLRFKKYENFQKLYAPGGKLLKVGDIFKNPELARTLRLIAKEGRDAYYKGKIAKDIVQYSKKVGGFFQYQDFAEFHSQWVEPLSINYKGYDVWELPPNGQGIAVLQMLNMLKNLDLKSMSHNSSEYLHTLIEIKKLVFEDRAHFYADPRFAKLPINRLLSDEYAKKRLTLFNKNRANNKIPLDDSILEGGDTVYLTVVDKDLNAVSLIQSNYAGFGSGMVPDELGFCLQDRGALFSLEEGHANVLKPGKRPFHTIIPAFVTKDNKPVFSFGVMGGAMQPQGHVQVLLNILEFGMNIQEAGDAARFRHTGSSQPDYGSMTDGGNVHLESGITPQVIRELMGKGHTIRNARGGFGGYQGIWIDHKRGILIGASESRKDGCAIGY
jgi:gamma-glutamyltranspeptidase/glutathione hydrolase